MTANNLIGENVTSAIQPATSAAERLLSIGETAGAASADADVSAEELCEQLGVGRDALLGALRELEFSGFIVNMTPDRPPLMSSWRITCFSCQGQPPTRDYERPEVIERVMQRQAERKAAYRRNHNVR